jgi:hypothetical protein
MPCHPKATHHHACACREEAHLLEVSELRRERDEALQEVATLRAECASISAEFDLPPTMRPVEGEIRRMRQTMRECADVADAYKRERDEARAALVEHERRAAACPACVHRKRLEADVAVLRAVVRGLLRTHDGVHAEDCRAYMAGVDAYLPDDPSDADPACTCGATEVRQRAREAVR